MCTRKPTMHSKPWASWQKEARKKRRTQDKRHNKTQNIKHGHWQKFLKFSHLLNTKHSSALAILKWKLNTHHV
jgi:hypothetical protein